MSAKFCHITVFMLVVVGLSMVGYAYQPDAPYLQLAEKNRSVLRPCLALEQVIQLAYDTVRRTKTGKISTSSQDFYVLIRYLFSAAWNNTP